ncbi:UBX domain-containing protein 10 isoform X1 [Antechinus flavipes]|uniref:UBX domain-containing protein 10 isoform X1 n=2 Tax=Antechinus flavipes TaxID=38775 RepID=UPI002235CF7B|nr:UBX domain-containing protein 10 isoform X1 [Antechinus flavipes]
MGLEWMGESKAASGRARRGRSSMTPTFLNGLGSFEGGGGEEGRDLAGSGPNRKHVTRAVVAVGTGAVYTQLCVVAGDGGWSWGEVPGEAMATEAPLNIAPSECSPALDPEAAFFWRRSPVKMHVTRPKSAKGRTRTNLNYSHSSESSSYRKPPSPAPVVPCEVPGSQKSVGSTPKPPSQGTPDEIPELLQQVPVGSSSSLNKYRVLPSINKKNLEEGPVETVAKQAGTLKLGSLQELKALCREEARSGKSREGCLRAAAPPLESKPCSRTKERSLSRAGNLDEPSDGEPRLLLAVRSPSGQRFVRHFRPTDNLQTVVAVAEQKNLTTYHHCSIETMEVPRRSFSDLSKSLEECRIPHKSVLGILQEEREGQP